jgi:hypothetical protein
VGLWMDFDAAIAEISKAADRSASAAHRLEQAMDRFYSWFVHNRGEFYSGDDRHPPPGGWLGEVMDGSDWKEVGIQPWIFDRQMEQNGFKPGDILEAMHQANLIRMDGTRYPKGHKGGARLLFIKKGAFS